MCADVHFRCSLHISQKGTFKHEKKCSYCIVTKQVLNLALRCPLLAIILSPLYLLVLSVLLCSRVSSETTRDLVLPCSTLSRGWALDTTMKGKELSQLPLTYWLFTWITWPSRYTHTWMTLFVSSVGVSPSKVSHMLFMSRWRWQHDDVIADVFYLFRLFV